MRQNIHEVSYHVFGIFLSKKVTLSRSLCKKVILVNICWDLSILIQFSFIFYEGFKDKNIKSLSYGWFIGKYWRKEKDYENLLFLV